MCDPEVMSSYVPNVCICWLQRGSDELLAQTSMVTNGTAMSPIQTELNNEAKKVMGDSTERLNLKT